VRLQAVGKVTITMDTYQGKHSLLSPSKLFPRFSSFWRRTNEAWEGGNEIRIYSHSAIIYWWPVWLYAAFCWVATYVHHVSITPGDKTVNVFPSPWLGLSFLCVFFFVVIFSNVKVQGFYALLVTMAIALLVIGIHAVIGLDRIFGAFHLLFIYMNEAFYAAMAIVMFALWFGIVYGVDRMTYYRFRPGLVSVEHRYGQSTGVNLSTDGMTVRLMATDFFRHQILGLRFLGFGTGDFICKPSAVSGHEPLVLENVIHLAHKFRRIEDMVNKNT
jgi:hypothetical protein